jgi:hypothetical protein
VMEDIQENIEEEEESVSKRKSRGRKYTNE